jgi:hypothetical protein
MPLPPFNSTKSLLDQIDHLSVQRTKFAHSQKSILCG